MLTKLWGIIINSFTETIRQPIYAVLVFLTIGVLTLNVWLAMFTLEVDSNNPNLAGDTKMLKDLQLSTLLLSGLFLAAFSAAGILSREIENKTVLTVISKPVPRPLFLFGKFTGLLGAMALAFYLCAIVFLLTIRHKVMERASDQFDLPVIISGVGALLTSIMVAAFCNYFYGMHFSTTVITLLLALLTVALALVAFIDPKGEMQKFGQDFIDGQLVGAAVLVFAMVMVLTAVAVAVSTRFGQVMTLIVCALFLAIGLTSDSFFGQHRETSKLAQISYWISPNLAFLWVSDALTQGSQITFRYVSTAFGYAMLLVVAWLSIGVALFQKREVG
jgi:ABC-2 type transport system permease protein